MQKKYNSGATLVELIVGLVIASILIAAVWSITSTSLRTAENVGGTHNSDFTAKFFIETFTSDIESASNLSNRPAIWINNSPLPPNGVATSATNWSISIFSVVPATKTGPSASTDPTYSQLVTYRLSPYSYDPNNRASHTQRQAAFPNELWILKSKRIWAGTIPDTGPVAGPPTPAGGVPLVGGDVMLLKIKNFSCVPSVNTYIGGLDCTLSMFGSFYARTQGGAAYDRTYRFYADAKNQP